MKLALHSLCILVAFATCPKEASGAVTRSLSEEDAQKIKEEHLLKADVKLQLEFISSENPAIKVGGRTVELDKLEEYSVLASDFKITIDKKAVETPPKSKLFAGNIDGTSFFFVKDEQNHAEFLHVNDGSSETSMHAVGHEGEMVVIKPEDYDEEKMNKLFQYGDSSGEDEEVGEGEDGGVKIDPNIDYDALTEPPQPDSVQMCGSLREIEISIMFDSSFRRAFGGGDGSGAVSRIQTIIGLVSQRYQQTGLCSNFRITEIEGYCNFFTDIWRNVVSSDNLLTIFSNWMNENRQGTRRDVAHFFSGTDFNRAGVIGRAFLGSLCELDRAYGIDWITFSFSQTSQSILVTHELGHNAGAGHFGSENTGHIMNPILNSAQNGFSSTSINSMNDYLNRQSCVSSGGGGGGGKNTSRRRLQSTASKSFNPGDETYHKYLEACGDFEYPLFLHVDKHSHLMVYGVPPKQAMAAGCPFGAAHSVFAHSEEGKPITEKEIIMWSNVDEGLSMFMEEESLAIGTFKLADLAQAYEDTPDDDSSGGGVYDIVTNNCATFMIKMASTLGVKIDSRITSFVARRLLEESGKDLANKIRNSVNYFSLFGDRRRNLRSSEDIKATNKLTDEELVEALVNKGASAGSVLDG